MSKARDKNDISLDFSQKWQRHLRETAKTTTTLTCRWCRDKRILPDIDSLYEHLLSSHPKQAKDAPPREDVAATRDFKEKLRAQASAPSVPRPSRDNTSTKPHEELSAAEADAPANSAGHSSGRPGSMSYPTPLTTGKLHDLTSQFKRQDSNSMSKQPGSYTSNKKRAIGTGKSPTSSVHTTHSYDSQRQPISAPWQQQTSMKTYTSTPKTRDLKSEEITRPPVSTGKRLWDAQHDSPFATATPLTGNATQRPRSSPQQHHQRNQKSVQSAGPLHIERTQPGVGPGTIPVSLLGTNLVNEQESPQDTPKIVRQPETRPISQEQLVAEVKGIYAGLVMVEGKCIQVDAKQAALAREAPLGTQPKLNNEQWQALIALHRTLLHEHHDFFLASQHPSATPAVRRLAIKYAMPARLWRHGIHSFLELLRNRLPESLDHMLAFIYLAYSMMTLLFETVPAFEETWIECLGDLGRYRMAIEDDDIRDREVWTQVARQWYLKASDKAPETGRLYHHLAILARPNALQQLFFYYKALSVPQPFVAARESILTLLEPVLHNKQTRRLPAVITAFVRVHAILFMRSTNEDFNANLTEYVSLLDGHIGRVTQKYLEQGYYVAIANCLALLGFGLPDSPLLKATNSSPEKDLQDKDMMGVDLGGPSPDTVMFDGASQIFVRTVEINLGRIGDPNILSFLHVTMVFMVYMSHFPKAMKLLTGFPWATLVVMLNTLLRFYHRYDRIESDQLPEPEKDEFRPTPEEFALRGLFWTEGYFSADWFRNKNIEDENQYKEDASMNTEYRPERILWLGCQLAKSGEWICYSSVEHKFSLPRSKENIDDFAMTTPFSEPELDSGTESTTDTATIMADCDADVDETSFASRTSTGFSDDLPVQSIRASSTWGSQGTAPDYPVEKDGNYVSATTDVTEDFRGKR